MSTMTFASHPAEMTLYETGSAIRCKQLSALEVAQACLERIEAIEPSVNAFIEVEAERLTRGAIAADAELARGRYRGPLHGIPLAHKDMFYRRGRVSTCGSRARFLQPATSTATVLQRLDGAGALCAGFLHMTEFAIGPTGHSEQFGACRNPWNLEHVPGGSSSGSAAAVAARLVYGSLGSDTGGSVRVPAAACSVVGLKPTNGRVSRHSIMPRAWSLDTVGPIGRSVRDVAILLQVIAGEDPEDPTSSSRLPDDYVAATEASPTGLRLGLPRCYGLNEACSETRAALDDAVLVFRSLGINILDVDVPDPAEIFPLADTIAKCEAATIHGQGLRENPEDYSAHARARIDAGFHIPATRYLEAQSLRGRFLRDYCETVFSKVDALLMPALLGPIPRLDEVTPNDSRTAGTNSAARRSDPER
ncbi:amidase [Aurantimonas sp. C2-3-R2]|uniref:amidase n=1 Tax=Aurantimonas sp. C2-3-R2 TaxID=3114363 RepID=UPI002E17AF50|nr:amidase [Aurantimonas sp. C2-3-R2]